MTRWKKVCLVKLPLLALCPLALVACASSSDSVDEVAPALADKALSRGERLARLTDIRDVARASGLENAAMLAGIASAETGLAHCWHEATWACQGPWSADCGGPVIAGAGDGPCSWREGGLGMFQFDAGTFDDTLRRDGEKVLRLAGNVERGVDFVADMLVRSRYVSVSSRAEALRWLSGVRPGTADFDAWVKTVTHYYNGCVPGACGVYWQRFDHYAHHARLVFEEQGSTFWTSGGGSGGSAGAGTTLAAIEVWWSRHESGGYAFKAIAPASVARVRYLVDGYVIADGVPRDDPATGAAENNFPTWYRFQSEVQRREVVVEGLDGAGRLVARGIGLLDAVPGTGIYIRQIAESVYQIGMERAPAEVATISVSVDGIELTDSESGARRSERLAVRSAFLVLGERRFVVTGYDSSGIPVVRSERTFGLE